MASAPDPKATQGHPLTRSLVPRTSAPPTSHTRSSAQNPDASTSDAASDAHSEDPIDSALTASSRTGQSLSALIKALGEFQGDLTGARDAQERLQLELEHVRDLLGRTNAERVALKARVATLEGELAERSELGRLDARYIEEEQDRFIAALIDEYEEALAKLSRERDEALAKHGLLPATESLAGPKATIPSPAPDAELEQELDVARRQIKKLTDERQKTRSLIQRAQQQRDAAQAKATRLEERLAQANAGRLTPRGDKHTRPTDPPPDAVARVNDSAAVTERPPKPKHSVPPSTKKEGVKRANRASKPGAAPRSRELQLSEMEQDWDRTTTPAPPPSYESALDESTRAPGSLRQPSPPAELRAALTTPKHLRNAKSEPPASSMPRVLRDGSGHGTAHRPGLYQSPTLPKVTPSLKQATESPSAHAQKTSQPPSTMGYPADKKPPLKRKPDPTKRPLVGYSKSGEEVETEHVRTRPSGATRTRS